MTTGAVVLVLVILARWLLALLEPRAAAAPARVTCGRCGREVAAQVAHWHAQAHERGGEVAGEGDRVRRVA